MNNVTKLLTCMHQTQDPKLCPVGSWAAIYFRIREYPDATSSTPINMYMQPGKQQLLRVTSRQVLRSIRAVVECISKGALRYFTNKVGTHSLWSATAMAMYLAGVPVYTIMLIGR